MRFEVSDTICAISTAPGVAAIGVIRLSGGNAVEVAASIFKGKDLRLQSGNTLHHGHIFGNQGDIDEVVISLFKSPASYTGEDVVEISCHGSTFIQSEILKVLIAKGARPAREGEFTLRAFLNGKLDLSQAEAVADLIISDSRASSELALQQLKGGYSSRLKELRKKLIHLTSLLELELDFSEEDVEFANRNELQKLSATILEEIRDLEESFDQGNAMKNGIPVAIIGRPNVGKSTLLNCILQEERAIVSEIPGTTRDIIEDDISIGGIMFRFIDTAGLRDTADGIEKIGIEKARKRAASSKIVLQLHDASESASSDNSFENKQSDGRLVLNVYNKIDKLLQGELLKLQSEVKGEGVFFISALSGNGIKDLLDFLLKKVAHGPSQGAGLAVSNVRHLEALQKSSLALGRVQAAVENGISLELIAQDLRQALHYLGEITGEVYNDEILTSIFSKFCIGK